MLRKTLLSDSPTDKGEPCMVTKKIVVIGLLSISGIATAASDDTSHPTWNISGKVRMDVEQYRTQTKSGSVESKTDSSSEVLLKNAEFKLSGESSTNKFEINYLALSNTLEIATITHKFNEALAVVAGKMYLLVHSWEWDYATSDQYVNSMVLAATPNFTDTGAQLNLTMSAQTLSFQAVEGLQSLSQPNGSQVTFKKKGGLSTAVQYRGEFNKMIRPLVTYTRMNPSSSNASDGKNYGNGYQTHVGLGVQLVVDDAQFEAEVDQIITHKLKEDVSDTNKEQLTQSIVLQGKYAIGLTTPFIKLISDSVKTGMTNAQIDAGFNGDLSGTQIVIGLEHKLDETCRLHVFAHNEHSSKKIAAGQTEKITKNGFNFGVTAAM